MPLRALWLSFWIGVLALPALAQSFPELTGRIVDQARILDAATVRRLTEDLLAHERATSNQIVVVTLNSLEGHDIADYGYRLGRHWGIGQEGRDNGVLLIVAPNERKVRIEVGYGLEGALPDVLAHQIIEDEILPRFRNGDMRGGIVAGASAVLQAIEGEYEPLEKEDAEEELDVLGLGLILTIILIMMIIRVVNREARSGWGREYRHRRHFGDGIHIGGSGGGLGGGGGGFGGGGGGFGGGGSSGSW